MTRCFLGIPIPASVKEELVSIQAQLSKFCKFKGVEQENLHITLKFLGSTDDQTIRSTIKTLETIDFSKYKVRVKGVHVFPDINFIKIFSFGLFPDMETVELNTKINQALETKEERKYIPHITLARIRVVKDKEALIKFINESNSFSSKEFGVNNFILFKSTLTEKGPIYEIIKKFDLK
jgi:2'-5' RNA ligase